MPFPLAHPAAVLPLVRKPFVASALVAGAIAPDLLYIGPLYDVATRIHGSFTLTLTHKLTSTLWLDPLLALLALAVFHLLLKRPLVALAPTALAARLPDAARRSLFWTVVSVVLGGFTHVLWDSFTHYDGYFVRRYWSFFTADITAAWDLNRVLQYLSSIGGVLVILYWLYRWWRRAAQQPVDARQFVPARVRYAVLVVVVASGVVGAVLSVLQSVSDGGSPEGEALARWALTGLGSGCVGAVTAYVVGWHLVRLVRLVRLGKQREPVL